MADGGGMYEHLRYADDLDAQRFVASHPDGATRDEVGVALGLTREGVREIEKRAAQKLVRGRGRSADRHGPHDGRGRRDPAPAGRAHRQGPAVADVAAALLARRRRPATREVGARGARRTGVRAMSECVICGSALPRSRRTYCSATCAAVVYGSPRTRTLRDQVARDLFFASEALARTEAPTHEQRARVDYLHVWLAELDRTGAGKAIAHPPRRQRSTDVQLALALSEVA